MSTERLRRLSELNAQRRRAVRHEVDYPTMAWRSRGEQFDARLIDISSTGFHARCEHRFDRGENLRVLLPVLGVMEAQIAWSLSGCCGGWFVDPVGAVAFADMLTEIRLAEGR
ncbi:MAG: PilZ domain-containing protein [Sphingobium sp.]